MNTQILSPEAFNVLREKGTEYAYTGKYNDFKEKGAFICGGCGNELFDSKTKYESGSGWGTETLIDSNNTNSAYEPRIAFDSSDNAMLIWTQEEGAIASIWVNRYLANSGWNTPEKIENSDVAYAGTAQISVNANGVAMAIYQLEDDTTEIGSVWSSHFE